MRRFCGDGGCDERDVGVICSWVAVEVIGFVDVGFVVRPVYREKASGVFPTMLAFSVCKGVMPCTL